MSISIKNLKKHAIIFIGTFIIFLLSILYYSAPDTPFDESNFIILIHLIPFMLYLVVFFIFNNIYIARITYAALFFHLILFPHLYVWILNNDSDSLAFDKKIFNTERQSYLAEINENYNREIVEYEATILSEVLSDSVLKLDKTFDNLEFLYSDKFIISKQVLEKDFPTVPPRRGISKNNLKVFSKERDTSLIIKNVKLGTIRSIVEKKLDDNSMIIIKNHFFSASSGLSYSNVLSYSINIFFNDNMTPKSRFANIVYFLHYIVVFWFCFAILTNAITSTRQAID